MKTPRAIIIVDVQRAFAPPPRYLKKLERYARCFTFRYHTQFLNPRDSMFRRVLKQKSCLPGTPDTDLLLTIRPGDVVLEKTTYGLREADLRRMRRRGIKRITVCGLDTDACVLGVLFSLFDAGIECHVKESMCLSSSGLHKPAMRIVRTQFPRPR